MGVAWIILKLICTSLKIWQQISKQTFRQNISEHLILGGNALLDIKSVIKLSEFIRNTFWVCWGSADFLPPSLMCPVFPAPLWFLFVCLLCALCLSLLGMLHEHGSRVSAPLALCLHTGSSSAHQESPAISLLNPGLQSQHSLNRQLHLVVTYQTSALYLTWILSRVSNFLPLLSTSDQCARPKGFPPQSCLLRSQLHLEFFVHFSAH